jgi:type VII secretion-associated serine protease mycosin
MGVWALTSVQLAPAALAAPVAPAQWYLDAMRAPDMWKVTTGQGIKVAVIDSGVNPDTPSLRGQVLKGLDTTETSGDETDDFSGHGTTMAELIAGTGKGGGLRGLAPGVKIIPYRVSDFDYQKTQKHVNGQDTADAIRAAADSDARIISMSMGSDYTDAVTRQAAEYAHAKGKLFFAAAGNNAKTSNKAQYPAAYDEVVGVASADDRGKVSDYSQHGANVDLAAPGNDIAGWCDESFKRYCGGDGGTSSATAVASASAALIWSANPEWTANQVLRAMIDTAGRDWAEGTRSKYLGHGLIRPRQIILEGKGDPGAPDISPLTNERSGGAPAPAEPSAPAGPSAPAPSTAPDAAPGSGTDTAVSESEGSGVPTGLIAGGVAAVVVLGAGVFLFLRRRGA